MTAWLTQANVPGLRPDEVLPALALIGVFIIFSDIAIAFAKLLQARLARKSNQPREVATLKAQEYDRLGSRLDRAREDLPARVHLKIRLSGTDVEPHVHLRNYGPGNATMLTYGLQRGEWTKAASDTPITLDVDQYLDTDIEIPVEVLTGTSKSSWLPGASPEAAVTVWAQYSDATGAWWRMTNDTAATRTEGPQKSPPTISYS